MPENQAGNQNKGNYIITCNHVAIHGLVKCGRKEEEDSNTSLV